MTRTDHPSPPRRLAAVQLVSSTVDGLALSSIVVHASLSLRLAPTTIGLVLAGAAAVAAALAVPTGALADRIGLRRAGAAAGGCSAVALLGYGLASSLPTFAVAAGLFVLAQATSGSTRQGLAVVGVPATARLGVRATMHALLNTGLGAGAVLGAVLVGVGDERTVRLTYLLAALVSLVSAATLLRGPDGVRPAAERAAGSWVVLRDHRFAAATALATLVQLTMPILAVLLPVWVLRHTSAPTWTAGAALAVNTALVIVGQRPWTARLVDARSTARSALVAAGALTVAGLLLALSSGPGSTTTVVVVLAAVVALTLGEVAGGAALWQVALQHVPPHAEGRYQSAFAMSASGARVLGPLVALPLVLSSPPTGWIVLTVPMAAACLVVARMAVTERRPAQVLTGER